jgi:hypothetical protein
MPASADSCLLRPDVADNIRGALEAIDKNEEFIKITLAVMMAPE